VALAGALLAGCAVAAPVAERDATDWPASSGLPAGVTVALLQLRSDVAARQAQVEVRNGGTVPVQIGDVEVTDPRFAAPATRIIDRTSTVLPGGTVNIRIQLPEMSCDAAEGESTVELTFVGDGTESVGTAPLPDRLGFVPPLHERECRAQALADAAEVTFASFTPSPPGEPAGLALEIVPTGKGAVRIAAIQSTNLLTYPGGQVRFPIDLALAAGDTAQATVPLPLVPLRCDPHAVLEDKRGTVFNLEIELEGEPGLVQIAADEDMRGRMLTWVAQWCEFDKG
jgi:hypothetical protein